MELNIPGDPRRRHQPHLLRRPLSRILDLRRGLRAHSRRRSAAARARRAALVRNRAVHRQRPAWTTGPSSTTSSSASPRCPTSSASASCRRAASCKSPCGKAFTCSWSSPSPGSRCRRRGALQRIGLGTPTSAEAVARAARSAAWSSRLGERAVEEQGALTQRMAGRRDVRARTRRRGPDSRMNAPTGHWSDFGMDTISLAGRWSRSCTRSGRPVSPGHAVGARPGAATPTGVAAAVRAVQASGLRVTGFQVLRDFEGLSAPARLQGRRRQGDARDVRRARLADPARLLVDLVPRLRRPRRNWRGPAQARHARGAARHQDRLRGLSWGRTINDFPPPGTSSRRADMPNLGIGFDSFHILATKSALDELEMLLARDDLSGAALRLHVAEMPFDRGAHRHRAPLPRLPRRGRAQRPAGRARAAAATAGLPRRLQLRGLQRRLPADGSPPRSRNARAAAPSGWERKC